MFSTSNKHVVRNNDKRTLVVTLFNFVVWMKCISFDAKRYSPESSSGKSSSLMEYSYSLSRSSNNGEKPSSFDKFSFLSVGKRSIFSLIIDEGFRQKRLSPDSSYIVEFIVAISSGRSRSSRGRFGSSRIRSTGFSLAAWNKYRTKLFCSKRKSGHYLDWNKRSFEYWAKISTILVHGIVRFASSLNHDLRKR